MKEQGRLLLSVSAEVEPGHFIVAIDDKDCFKVVYNGSIGDKASSLFALAFTRNIVRSGKDAYLIVTEQELEWFRENLNCEEKDPNDE